MFNSCVIKREKKSKKNLINMLFVAMVHYNGANGIESSA